MYDSISRGRVAGTQTKIYAECAAALGVTIDDYARAVETARNAGYDDDEAVNVAYDAIAHCAVRGARGPAAEDPVRAWIFRYSPDRADDATNRRSRALASLGNDLDWQGQVLGDYEYRDPVVTDSAVVRLAARLGIPRDEALRRLRIERNLREIAWRRWPSHNSGWARKRRTRYVRAWLATFGYWPGLQQQLYLPAPACASVAVNARCAPHRSQRTHEAERKQMAFVGEGWRVAA